MIKVKFIRWDSTILMKVLEMDEVFRDNINTGGEIICKEIEDSNYFEAIKIKSSDHPEIRIKGCNKIEIFLWGVDKNKDKEISYIRFGSVEEAKEFVKYAKIAIEEINNKENKFKKPEDIQEIEVY